MADDPYKVLGLAKTATEDEIRRTYRKLAKELHPDLNPVNRAAAEERFKAVASAYAIVGDDTKRRQYDQGLIGADGEPRRPQRAYAGAGHPFAGRAGPGGGDEFGFGDIFGDVFGRRTGGVGLRGQDVRYTLEVEFLESASGTKKRVTLPEGGTLDLAVPAGVADGQVLRLKAKGQPAPRGGEPGDALVEIKVRAHADFKRTGDDIEIEVPITIDEAVLGAKIEVPTVSGRVHVTIPKATSSGAVFRLKGRGIVNAATARAGDQLVRVRIVLPETIDDNLAYFLSEWRQTHKYDPGRKS